MTCTDKKMVVGFSVSPDRTYFDVRRVNRLNLLLETVQDAYCNVATEMLKSDKVDGLFDQGLADLDCTVVLKQMKDGYMQVMSKQSASPQHDILKPAVAVGYELLTGIVQEACGKDDKLTRDDMVKATKALIRVACNVD